MEKPLPRSAQAIADVIGRQATLYLIGKLPRCYSGAAGHKSHRVILYVPVKLKPQHKLCQILGTKLAQKLVWEFGGQMLYCANCRGLYDDYRDRQILRMLREGVPCAEVAQIFGMTEKHIRSFIH